MQCPACNKQFPQGTVFCSRCHATLIEDVAEADEFIEKAYPGSALVHFWRGEDAALHASLLEALRNAGISFYEQPLGSGPSARPIDHLLDHSHPQFGFEVAVLSSCLAEAEIILEKLLRDQWTWRSPQKKVTSRQSPRPERLLQARRRAKCGRVKTRVLRDFWKRRYERTGFPYEWKATAKERLFMLRPKRSYAPRKSFKRLWKEFHRNESWR